MKVDGLFSLFNLATTTAKNTNTSESWGTHDSGLARDLDDREMDDTTFFGSPQVG